MTQQELAEQMDVTRQTILTMEKGKYAPSLELAFRIARVFDIQLNEEFTYDVEDYAFENGC
jgi:putative transcriptional regulator